MASMLVAAKLADHTGDWKGRHVAPMHCGAPQVAQTCLHRFVRERRKRADSGRGPKGQFKDGDLPEVCAYGHSPLASQTC
jgi:hypothetical protein